MYLACCSFIFGLAIGSFLNVVIYRVPRNLSIVRPPSSCPDCGRMIRPWENIPLISYFLLLRGRCAGCGKRISMRYPLIELFTGILFASVALRYGLSLQTLVFCAVSAVLLALSVIDLQTKLLPDCIVLPSLIGACILAVATLYEPIEQLWPVQPTDAFFGMAAGGLPLLAVAWIYMQLTGRDGMGGGDIKLMFFIGALLGPAAVLLTLFIGSLSGSIIGLVYLRLQGRERHTQIPFGPFLAAGAWISLMWGDSIVSAYLQSAGLSGRG